MIPLNITPFSSKLNCTEVPENDFASCQVRNIRQKATIVYFIIAIINFIFVVTTTTLFIYRATINVPYYNKKPDLLQQEIQRRPLRMRGLFGTLLNAIGHLVFSTSTYLFQSFYVSISCDILLWGTLIGLYTWIYSLCWCAYRLHVLLRLGTLKQEFLRNRDQRDISDSNCRWFMRHKNFDSLNANTGLPIYTSTLVALITVCSVTEAIHTTNGRCQPSWGNFLVLLALGVLFVVVIPIIWWKLRNYKDSHGIRNEIMIQCIFGIPCIVLFMVWIGAFQPSSSSTPSVVRAVFVPGNWAVLMTSAGHFFFIIKPLIKSYQKDDNIKIPNYEEGDDDSQNQRLRIQQYGNNIDRLFVSTEPGPSFASSNRRNARTDLPRLPGTSAHYEMTKNALEQALEDPDAVKILEDLATKDFSVENVLFYKEYLKLRKKIKDSQQEQQQQDSSGSSSGDGNSNGDSSNNNTTQSCRLHQQRSIIDVSNSNNSCTYFFSSTSSLSSIPVDNDEEQSMMEQQQIHNTIPHSCIPACVSLYHTFISDDAPLQVNISANARKLIEAGMIIRTGPLSNRESISISESDFTLEMFEKARSEVFWNIFTSVFPKLVSSL